jgi:D-tagatose-1,6-bisphosphate aldolase subunit GatZ/KbaZ
MFLDEVVIAQKRGEAKGITSICTANPWVLKAAMKASDSPLLIEATCNQVNQFGGYTGMTPSAFLRQMRVIAETCAFPFENIILGGDHLGPSVWQDESADSAMSKAEALVQEYVQAGFIKIHLDCSMLLADDPNGALDVEISAERTARLAKVAEAYGGDDIRYVIGSEVPIPGGATEHEEGVQVTSVKSVQEMIDTTREVLLSYGLNKIWERVIAIVVQPGVEFGDDFVLAYQPSDAKELSNFIETQPQIYEAHSTDYQTSKSLREMVRDHFAILKVGPALTFALREAIFALAMMEDELFGPDERSNIISVLDRVMEEHPQYWAKYYHGSEKATAFKRKYSLSDRIRYYWSRPRVHDAFNVLLKNLNNLSIPMTLLNQYVPDVSSTFIDSWKSIAPEQVMLAKIQKVLIDYDQACNPQ